MLPIYNATAVNKGAIHSGTTKPSVMTLANDTGTIIGEYVVKVFTPKTLAQAASTNKEVYGSILATQFELNTPKAVLVEVPQSIIDTLNKERKYPLKKGIYFATEYMENILDYSSANQNCLELWDMETIFAFDVLIKNIDRRKKKNNLFVKDNEVYVIDHELSFAANLLDQSFVKSLDQKERYWQFIELISRDGSERKHLFLDQLRQQNEISPIEFDTFAYYLNDLDVDILDEYQQQLQDTGNDTEDYYAIKSYLVEVKNNSGLFIQLLKDLIL